MYAPRAAELVDCHGHSDDPARDVSVNYVQAIYMTVHSYCQTGVACHSKWKALLSHASQGVELVEHQCGHDAGIHTLI